MWNTLYSHIPKLNGYIYYYGVNQQKIPEGYWDIEKFLSCATWPLITQYTALKLLTSNNLYPAIICSGNWHTQGLAKFLVNDCGYTKIAFEGFECIPGATVCWKTTPQGMIYSTVKLGINMDFAGKGEFRKDVPLVGRLYPPLDIKATLTQYQGLPML